MSASSVSPSVTVIVPSLGRFVPLLDTIGDLLAQDYPAFEIVVIDQNAAWPPELIARKSALEEDARIRWLAFPPGVVRARNHAAAVTSGEILLFVDDDVRIPNRGFIRRHVAAYGQPGVDAVCGRELKAFQVDAVSGEPLAPASDTATTPAGDTPFSQLLQFDRSQANRATVPTLSTCNSSVRRQAFEAVGGFDEAFQGASYGDDADLALRLWAAGSRIAYEPGAWLVHLLAPAGGLRLSDPRNPFTESDKALSGLIMLFRHAGRREVWPVLYGWVLRRSVLLKRNLERPWRQPQVMLGLLRAAPNAWRAARRPPPKRARLSAYAGE